jgi:predicted thioesterase
MIRAGDTAEASLTVQPGDTARGLSIAPEDEFPEVFATSRMVALMELAAARVMHRMLQPGELSVGVSVDVRHTAATPVGCTVRAVATYIGAEGRQHRFRIEAFDETGPIGDATHTRAVISTERLLRGAEKRRKKT